MAIASEQLFAQFKGPASAVTSAISLQLASQKAVMFNSTTLQLQVGESAKDAPGGDSMRIVRTTIDEIPSCDDVSGFDRADLLSIRT
ncbi:hypothetical protein J6590_098102, partial [Homalodisca vitripennis]